MTRLKQLGDLGEKWTRRLLEEAGFTSIQDLNASRNNHPGGDFIAERSNKRYFISVKARNKYQRGSGKLNSAYNIHPEKVRKASEEYSGTIPAWIVIQVDTNKKCFSAYFGTIDSLRNPQAVAVPMTDDAVKNYITLTSNRVDEEITDGLSNQV